MRLRSRPLYRSRRSRRPRRAGRLFGRLAIGAAVAVFAWSFVPTALRAWPGGLSDDGTRWAAEWPVYLFRCDHAWTAGAAPIPMRSPGYREGLDADGDGVACEPYQGR
jgi:hypothetical protein